MEPATQMLFIKMGANAGLSEVGAITYWGLAAGSFCCGRFVTAFADYDFFICVSAAMIQCVNLNLPKRNQISPLINCNILVAACSGTGKTPLYTEVMGDCLDHFHDTSSASILTALKEVAGIQVENVGIRTLRGHLDSAGAF